MIQSSVTNYTTDSLVFLSTSLYSRDGARAVASILAHQLPTKLALSRVRRGAVQNSSGGQHIGVHPRGFRSVNTTCIRGRRQETRVIQEIEKLRPELQLPRVPKERHRR